MKYFLSLFVLCFSFNAIAQESTYEPYKAEYYIGKFKPGKDMGDMVKWLNGQKNQALLKIMVSG